MTREYWRTTTKSLQHKHQPWPTIGQIGRQLGLILVVGIIWGGLFAGFIRLTTPTAQTEPASTVPALAVAPETPTPLPTDTPAPLPTAMPMQISPELPEPSTPTATVVREESTDTPTPTIAPTHTPIPPTDTPPPIEEEPAQISFSNDVLPIFEQRCFKCHGGEDVKNGFSVESYETVMQGSWNGVVVEPGDTEGSYLFNLVSAGDMPKRGPRLLPAEIEEIRAWIEAGAPNN